MNHYYQMGIRIYSQVLFMRFPILHVIIVVLVGTKSTSNNESNVGRPAENIKNQRTYAVYLLFNPSMRGNRLVLWFLVEPSGYWLDRVDQTRWGSHPADMFGWSSPPDLIHPPLSLIGTLHATSVMC